MIPKIIHQIWFQGEANIPSKFIPLVKSWRELNPEFDFLVWDEVQINALMDLYPEYKQLYDSYELMIQRVDFFKYVILYLLGGMYIDVDVLCLKSVLPLISQDKDLIICHAPYDLMDRAMATLAGHNPFKKLINNGIIAAIPRSPHMAKVIEYCQKFRKSKWRKVCRPIYIFRTTGPIMFTKAMAKEGFSDRVEVLDRNFFEACNCFNVHRGCKPPDYAYGLHLYELSWMKNTFYQKVLDWYMKIK